MRAAAASPPPRSSFPPGRWCATPSAHPGWTRIQPQSAYSASAWRRMRGSQTAIGSRFTGRSCSIRKSGAGSAPALPARNPARLFAPLGDGLLRALDLLGARLVVDEDPLSDSVHRAHALTALQLAQARLCLLAAGALLAGLGPLLACLLLRLLALLLALLERRFRAERLVLRGAVFLCIGRGRGGRRRAARGALQARHFGRVRRRRVAVTDLAVLVDPLISLRRGGARERQDSQD